MIIECNQWERQLMGRNSLICKQAQTSLNRDVSPVCWASSGNILNTNIYVMVFSKRLLTNSIQVDPMVAWATAQWLP
jgi:hypothetical protein